MDHERHRPAGPDIRIDAAGKKQLAVEESRWQTVTSAVNRVLRTV
jgi:hypothetical protein